MFETFKRDPPLSPALPEVVATMTGGTETPKCGTRVQGVVERDVGRMEPHTVSVASTLTGAFGPLADATGLTPPACRILTRTGDLLPVTRVQVFALVHHGEVVPSLEGVFVVKIRLIEGLRQVREPIRHRLQQFKLARRTM